MNGNSQRVVNRDAGRLALEGLVVVLSILIAFLLDGWGNDRQSRRQLNEELASVARELDENRGLVVYEIHALQRVISGSEALVEFLAAQSGNRLVPVPDTLAFLVAFWSPTLDASFGAVDALIASGRLSQIKDAELRLGLAGLKTQFADGVDDELQAQIIQNQQIFPMLSRDADFSGVYRIDQEFFALERKLNRQLTSANVTLPFPSSLEVRNAILNKTSWLGSGLGEMKRLVVQLDNLIALIGEETE